jgi:hypothetical protein
VPLGEGRVVRRVARHRKAVVAPVDLDGVLHRALDESLFKQLGLFRRGPAGQFITAAEAFNSPRDEGRVTKVLLHLQHVFEKLPKATPVQTGKPVFNQATGRSQGLERSIGLAMRYDTIKLSETVQRGLRTDPLPARPRGRHASDDILRRVFGERLNTLFPERVLPGLGGPAARPRAAVL